MHQVLRIRGWTPNSDDNGFTKAMEPSANQQNFLYNNKCTTFSNPRTHEPKMIDSKSLPSMSTSSMGRGLVIDTTSFNEELTSHTGVSNSSRMEDTGSTSSFDSLELVKETQALLSLLDNQARSNDHYSSPRRTNKRTRKRPTLEQDSIGCKVRHRVIDDFPTIEWSSDQDSSKSMSAIEMEACFSDILTPSCNESRKSTLFRSKSFGSLRALEATIG